MMRNRKVWGVLGLILALVVMTSYGQQPIWFLVHGKSGSPGNWTTVLEQMRMQRPALFWLAYIANLEQQNEVHLFTWAVNLVNEMERHGLLKDEVANKSVRVLAHSFGGAVTLYILRVAYELELGDINTLRDTIKEACKDFAVGSLERTACDKIGDGVASVPDKQKWLKAAKKIGEVYLYHPALLGGCGACVGNVSGNEAAACLCVLGKVGRILWDIPRITWAGQKKIFNIYGFGCDGVSCSNPLCGFDSGHHDKWLRDDHQRLLAHRDGDRSRLQSGSYVEIFGGCHCHSDFVNNKNGAAEALVKTISDLQPTVALAVKAKCGEDENIQVRIRVNPLPIGRPGEIKTPWRDNYKTGAVVSLTVLEDSIKCPQVAYFSHWQVTGGTIELGSGSSKEIYVILPKDTIAIAHYK